MIIRQREGVFIEGLKDLIGDLPDNIVMAEIGCYAGESALLFLQSGKVKEFYAIDIWARKQHVLEAEKVFDSAIKGYPVVKLKGNINKALPFLPMLDFVYIDGCHSYAAVHNDITKVLPKMKRGGIIGGHDYGEVYKSRVVRAVDELLGKPDKRYKDTSWIKYLDK